MRIKIEMNTYETSPALPHSRLPYQVESRWWSGSADVLTFQPQELVATKLRALFLAMLFERPYSRINTVAERCEVSRQTASIWLHALVRAELLSEVKMGRELLFVNHELLDVLTRPE